MAARGLTSSDRVGWIMREEAGVLEYVKERVSEVVEDILGERAPLEGWEFRREFEKRTGWRYYFLKGEVVKELRHGRWEVRVERTEDAVVTPEGQRYAVRATAMWLVDTLSWRFWVVEVSIERVSALPGAPRQGVR